MVAVDVERSIPLRHQQGWHVKSDYILWKSLQSAATYLDKSCLMLLKIRFARCTLQLAIFYSAEIFSKER